MGPKELEVRISCLWRPADPEMPSPSQGWLQVAEQEPVAPPLRAHHKTRTGLPFLVAATPEYFARASSPRRSIAGSRILRFVRVGRLARSLCQTESNPEKMRQLPPRQLCWRRLQTVHPEERQLWYRGKSCERFFPQRRPLWRRRRQVFSRRS